MGFNSPGIQNKINLIDSGNEVESQIDVFYCSKMSLESSWDNGRWNPLEQICFFHLYRARHICQGIRCHMKVIL